MTQREKNYITGRIILTLYRNDHLTSFLLATLFIVVHMEHIDHDNNSKHYRHVWWLFTSSCWPLSSAKFWETCMWCTWKKSDQFVIFYGDRKLVLRSTLSGFLNAIFLLMSKLTTVVGENSLYSLVGEWLLLIFCLLVVGLQVPNSWLLQIPGVGFFKLTSRNISWSTEVILDREPIGLITGEEIDDLFVAGEQLGDLTGGLKPALPGLHRTVRWWSHTTKSSMYVSVFALSAW